MLVGSPMLESLLEENRKIRAQARALRARTVRTRIEVIETFCGVAETHLRLNALHQASISLEKIRRAVSEVEFHLNEPNHLSEVNARELRAFLQTLKPRIAGL